MKGPNMRKVPMKVTEPMALKDAAMARLLADLVRAGHSDAVVSWARENPDRWAEMAVLLAQVAGFPMDLAEQVSEVRFKPRRKGRTGRRGGRMKGGWQRQ